MLDSVLAKLEDTINSYKAKPYLPFWGEFFVVLRELKKLAAEETNSRIFLYETKEAAPVYYQSDGRFCIVTPDFTIYLTEEEFIDSLLSGRFWPEPQKESIVQEG